MSTAAALLEQIIQSTQTRADVTAILHENVVLERLDGEVLRGRALVADAIMVRGDDSSLAVICHDGDDGVQVRMQFKEMAGELRFVSRAGAHHGVLVAIVMEL